MGMFDNAFKNDPAFDKKPAAKPSNTITVTFKTQKGEKTVEAVPGSRMAAVAASARVPIAYNCKNGECGTCEVHFLSAFFNVSQA